MQIRKATPEDAYAIWLVHTRSIRELCRADYTPEQIEGWAGPKKPEHYPERIRRDPTFVAEIAGKIVGFVRFNREKSELSTIYVDPAAARQGVGTALMQTAVSQAQQMGLTYFWLHASLTAVPFYQAMGFIYEEKISRRFNNIELPCVRMRLQFAARQGKDSSL